MEWKNFRLERLPEAGRIVLVRTLPDFGSYDIGFWETGHGFTSILTRRHIHEVTHWKYIEEPKN